jgi:hypothetical protein
VKVSVPDANVLFDSRGYFCHGPNAHLATCCGVMPLDWNHIGVGLLDTYAGGFAVFETYGYTLVFTVDNPTHHHNKKKRKKNQNQKLAAAPRSR